MHKQENPLRNGLPQQPPVHLLCHEDLRLPVRGERTSTPPFGVGGRGGLTVAVLQAPASLLSGLCDHGLPVLAWKGSAVLSLSSINGLLPGFTLVF